MLRVTFTERGGDPQAMMYAGPEPFDFSVSRVGDHLVGTLSKPPNPGEIQVVSVMDCYNPEAILSAYTDPGSTTFSTSAVEPGGSYRVIAQRGAHDLGFSIYVDVLYSPAASCSGLDGYLPVAQP